MVLLCTMTFYLTFNGVYLSDVSFVVTLVLNVMYGCCIH